MTETSRGPCTYTSLMELCPAQLPSLTVEYFGPQGTHEGILLSSCVHTLALTFL